MKTPSKTALCLTLGLAFALTACKPKMDEPTAEQKAAAAAAEQPATAAVVAPAPAAAPAAAPAQSSSTAIADLSKIAVITKPLPPFPFVDSPPAVDKYSREVEESDFDQLGVVVGDRLHLVEGRFRFVRFDLDAAKISEFQAKRDYTKAALDMGGVKVNTVLPNSEEFYIANGMNGDSEGDGIVR